MKSNKPKQTFDLVPQHVAVGVVGGNEGDGVTDRIGFHDVSSAAVVRAQLGRIGRLRRHSDDGHWNAGGGIASRAASVAGSDLKQKGKKLNSFIDRRS